MKVISHLRAVVAQKEIKEKRRIGIRVIVEESQASRSAVERLLNNTIKNVPLDDLGKLCMWASCEIGDILKLEAQPDPEQPTVA